LSGVVAAGVSFGRPFSGFRYGMSGYERDGQALTLDEQNRLTVQTRVITPDWFRALGADLQAGRPFTPADRRGSAPVAIVNEAAARLLWPGQNPIGHRFTIGSRMGQGGDERAGGEIVGVVEDIHEFGPAVPAPPTLYLAHAQWPMGYLGVAVRTTGKPEALVQPARAALEELDPMIPVFQVSTVEQMTRDIVSQPRLYATLLLLFGVVALVLSAIGVYGVLAASVSARGREIGVRMALGARRKAVVVNVISRASVPAAVGLAIGLAAALGTGQVLNRLLFEVSAVDATTYGVVVLTLVGTALLAAWLPARRAARVDPAAALRAE
jgi:putative ABC transport system permease protein